MNPCGRVVDVLRSCYAVPFRFFHNAPDVQTDCEWYFVPDDRKVVPFAHAFGSRIYEREELPEWPIGERYQPHPWRGGQEPCPATRGGLCGGERQWQEGCSISVPSPAVWPGSLIPICCDQPSEVDCGGTAIGDGGEMRCVFDTTFDVYVPFGAGAPDSTNNAGALIDDLANGRGFSPNNTVAWTHVLECDSAVNIADGCTRTVPLNTINYADGDEVRIPTGGTTRYAVVWVTLCDSEAGTRKRVYLMRHS